MTTEKPTSFQLTKELRTRMKNVAHDEKFPTMIKWLEHQIGEAEKRIKNGSKK